MFLSLFLKECKLNLKSITYYILCICIVGFLFNQIGYLDLREPQPTDKFFSYVPATDKCEIMQMKTEDLKREFHDNRYATYPLSFIKPVKLNKDNQEYVKSVIQELIVKQKDESYYNEFLKKMDTVDQLVGGTSKYSAENIARTSVPGTYETELALYNKILNEDHICDAYARTFSDYSGIIMGIMPVFLAVSVSLRDRKSKAEQVIYSSKISAAKIITARYLSTVLMITVPIIILAFLRDSQCIYYAKSIGIVPDYLIFTKFILGWIMPTIMVSAAVGFFFTELFKGVWAIFIQLIWWCLSIMSNHQLTGGIGFNLVPRFNSIGNREIYTSIFNKLVINRVMYFSLAIILVLATICIFNYRRSGRLEVNGKLLPSFNG